MISTIGRFSFEHFPRVFTVFVSRGFFKMSEKKSYEYDNAKNGDTKIVHSGDVEIQ